MKIAKTFTIDLSGTPCEIDAMISFTAYQILDVRPSDGYGFEFEEEHMEVFEQYVEEQIKTTTTQALNLETGSMETFTVTAWGSDILAIQNGTYSLPRHSPTWSEVAESWHIDREFEMAVESDAPHLAAAAGFLRAVPLPTQQGVGNAYRIAA